MLFGWYSLVMGLVLLLVPQIVLPWFGIVPGADESWMRLLGFVLCCSSYYYIRMSWAGSIQFARLTTHTRLAAPFIVLALILTGKADWHFLSFGIVDGLGGAWTWYYLKKATAEHI